MPATLARVDISDVERGLFGLEQRARSMGPAFSALKAAMKVDQREHRDQQMGPDGAWQPRAVSTVAAAKRKHKRLGRRLLGKLPTAVSYKALRDRLIGESRVRWSLSQQEGDRVGHGVKLPARPFLWMSDKFLDFAEAAIALMLVQAWGRA